MAANRLAGETSPYLLQHKDNPVAWWPWCPEAFAEARRLGRPVLLSVGYAACHWCHVMAHESFEDPETAAVMNRLFINIKVDREERPDVDAIYQTALALLGEQGGWPLTMFLTPDAEPFWGGTYFPPESRYGRPAFRDVLEGVADAFTREPEKVRHNADAIRDALRRSAAGPSGAALDFTFLEEAAGRLLSAIDTIDGGLAGAPKFPQATLFDFLWRTARRSGRDDLRQAVLVTLDRMSQGGIYDHLGGGFARYSTDARWLVPHFEKMLYDNAQLVDLLTLAWLETRKPLYRARVTETIGWMLREMTAEGGAFAATLDADSEGEEGRFYVWTADEIARLLPAEIAPVFAAVYDVRPEGNWEGRTILHRNHPQPALPDLEPILAEARERLWREREKRVRPHRDDKILADWNGMAIAALATAAVAFDSPDWLDAARAAFASIRQRLSVDGRLGHSYRDGRLQPAAVLDDYAHMARAALALFEATAEDAYLDAARKWVKVADDHYWDDDGGGYFLTADDAEGLIARTKPITDGAVPAANGVMAQVLARLFHLTGDDSFRRRAEAVIAAFAGLARTHYYNLTSLLSAYQLLAAPVSIVVVGDPADAGTRALRRVAAEAPAPDRLLLFRAPDQALPPGHPAAGKRPVAGRPTAYVCRGPVCSPPFTDPEALRAHLGAR